MTSTLREEARDNCPTIVKPWLSYGHWLSPFNRKHLPPSHVATVMWQSIHSCLFLLLVPLFLSGHAIASRQPFGSDESVIVKDSSTSLFDLHRDLVRIESITNNELAVGNYLVEHLTKRNFTVERQKIGKDRFNVFAYMGHGRRTRTLVTSHIDTVPPFYDYKVRGNELWGRGTADAKGCVAAQIEAVERLRAERVLQDGEVALMFVVGEEHLGDGMKAVNSLRLTWKTVIFGEPTELKLAAGHKGIFAFKVHAKGKSAHSGYPQLGVNANSLLVKALTMLDSMKLPSSDKFGTLRSTLAR